MPLHVPPAPAPALRSVLTALASPTAVRDARTPSLLRAQGPVTPELPLPVHVLDGTATRLAGWRFLIGGPRHDVLERPRRLGALGGPKLATDARRPDEAMNAAARCGPRRSGKSDQAL